MIRAVLFDVDGVLLDSFEANLAFYHNLMQAARYTSPSREEFRGYFHLTLKEAIRVMTSEEDVERIWKLAATREVAYPMELLAMPLHATQIVERLAKTYTLGIVTGRIRTSVYEFPALAALKEHFSVTVAYEDTVKHKPNPEPLLLAAEKLGVSPANIVYIGDAENDMIAARAAGMKAILYAPTTHAHADAHTNDFSALVELIAALSHKPQSS